MAAKVLGGEIVHRCSGLSTRFSFPQLKRLKSAKIIEYFGS